MLRRLVCLFRGHLHLVGSPACLRCGAERDHVETITR